MNQTKLNKPNKTKQKKLVLGPILAHLAQIWDAKIFFQKSGLASH